MKTAKDIFNEANCGIVGINDDLEIYGGYDDSFPYASEDNEDMTKKEKLLLADRMISLWKNYKVTVEQL